MPKKPYEGLPTEATAPEALTDIELDEGHVILRAAPLIPDQPERDAVRLMKYRATIEREIVRQVKLHMTAMEELDQWLAEGTEPLKLELAKVDAQIAAWHRRAHAEERAGLEWSTPFGTSKLGPEPRASLDITDEDALVEWCETHMPDVVKTKTIKSVPKNDFKARVAPPKGDTSPVMSAVTEDGEVVPGAQFKIPERTWKVTR